MKNRARSSKRDTGRAAGRGPARKPTKGPNRKDFDAARYGQEEGPGMVPGGSNSARELAYEQDDVQSEDAREDADGVSGGRKTPSRVRGQHPKM